MRGVRGDHHHVSDDDVGKRRYKKQIWMILLLFGSPRKNRQIRYSYNKRKKEEENLSLNPISQLYTIGKRILTVVSTYNRNPLWSEKHHDLFDQIYMWVYRIETTELK